jgi:hypothetical protein
MLLGATDGQIRLIDRFAGCFTDHRAADLVVGSHVPYESLVELRAAYMPDAARAVSGHPPETVAVGNQPLIPLH